MGGGTFVNALHQHENSNHCVNRVLREHTTARTALLGTKEGI